MKPLARFGRWMKRRTDMAELTAYCLAKEYAKKSKDWILWDACQTAIKRKAQQIAMDDLRQ